jgi:hypothetical protein
MEGGARRTFSSQVSNPGAHGKCRWIMAMCFYDFEMESRRQGWGDPALYGLWELAEAPGGEPCGRCQYRAPTFLNP